MHEGEVIFTIENNLRLLFQAQYVSEDGTLEYCPRNFEQLYTIHVHMMGYYVRVIYCFPQKKSILMYTEMWKGILP